MNWTTFYLDCFLVGLLLALVSMLSGTLHLPHIHIHFHHGGVPGAGAGGHGGVSWLNFPSIMAFLAWFGGVGYLLTVHDKALGMWIVVLATVAGLIGGSIVFWFFAKVLMKQSGELDPADYEKIGVLGQITNPIREGGTGELVFVQQGVRQVCGARSETGNAIAKGTEVVVTRYEKGIAFVRPWDELEASVLHSDQQHQ